MEYMPLPFIRRGGKGEGRMKNNDLYLGIGVGMAAGVLSGLLMRPKRKNVKSAVAQIISDMADSVSKNMGW
jgi:gas vesicle protein